MRKLFSICICFIVLVTSANAQLFNKTVYSKKKGVITDSVNVHFVIHDIKLTADKPLYWLEEMQSGYRFEFPTCRCFDLTGRKIGDTIIMRRTMLDSLYHKF